MNGLFPENLGIPETIQFFLTNNFTTKKSILIQNQILICKRLPQ